MYWHELNEKRIEQLRQSILGKKVIIVGNSVKLMQSNYGELIDSYDVVVRLGKGLTSTILHEVIGKKTDVWFTGMFRVEMYKQVDCRWKILTPSTSATFNDQNSFIPVNKVLFDTNFQPYRDYFWSDSIEQTKLHWKRLGFNQDNRPSQGLICADFFSRRLKHKDIDLIGFDFFTETVEINGITYNSWHLPKKSNTTEIAHNNKLEKLIINTMIKKRKVKLLPYHN